MSNWLVCDRYIPGVGWRPIQYRYTADAVEWQVLGIATGRIVPVPPHSIALSEALDGVAQECGERAAEDAFRRRFQD